MEITKLPETELQTLAEESEFTPVFFNEINEEQFLMSQYYFEKIMAEKALYDEMEGVKYE